MAQWPPLNTPLHRSLRYIEILHSILLCIDEQNTMVTLCSSILENERRRYQFSSNAEVVR